MIGRRNFLKALGLGGAAAPLAAKAAVENEILSLTASASPLASGMLGSTDMPQSIGDEYDTRLKMTNYTRLFGVPKHVMQQLEEEARWVYALDFDIANKRSWSLAAKVHEQRQRNLQRKVERLQSGGYVAKAKREFTKKFGFDFLSW